MPRGSRSAAGEGAPVAAAGSSRRNVLRGAAALGLGLPTLRALADGGRSSQGLDDILLDPSRLRSVASASGDAWIDPAALGADTTGIEDTTEHWVTCIESGKLICPSPGRYRTTKPLRMNQGTTIVSQPGLVTIWFDRNSPALDTWYRAAIVLDLVAGPKDDVTIWGISIEGNYVTPADNVNRIMDFGILIFTDITLPPTDIKRLTVAHCEIKHCFRVGIRSPNTAINIEPRILHNRIHSIGFGLMYLNRPLVVGDPLTNQRNHPINCSTMIRGQIIGNHLYDYGSPVDNRGDWAIYSYDDGLATPGEGNVIAHNRVWNGNGGIKALFAKLVTAGDRMAVT